MIVSNVKELMERRSITYVSLQETTGLDSKTITRARGELIRECRLSTLETIARALQVRIVDLFDEIFPESEAVS